MTEKPGMKWAKPECLECPCLLHSSCETCKHREASDQGRCPAPECADSGDCALALQELQLAAYREALRNLVGGRGRSMHEVEEHRETAHKQARDLLANPDGAAIVARLRAGERLARLACRLEWHDTIMDPHDGPVGYRCPVCGQDSLRGEHAADCELAAALNDYDKAVNPCSDE